MLVCWWWWFDCSFTRLIAPVVRLSPPPPSSFALIIPANSGSPRKWPLNGEREFRAISIGWYQNMKPFWILLQQQMMEMAVGSSDNCNSSKHMQNRTQITTINKSTLCFFTSQMPFLLSDSVRAVLGQNFMHCSRDFMTATSSFLSGVRQQMLT